MKPDPYQVLIVIVPATRLPSTSMTEKCVVSVPVSRLELISDSVPLGVAWSRRMDTRWPAA